MNNILNLLQIVNGLKSNPMSILSQYGLNIPQNINSPQDIVQHLLNTGQINQDQVNQAKQMQNNPMFKNLF